MLGDLETQLVDLLKGSELGLRLKVVDSLPDTPDSDLVKRWGLDAPAAYVVAADGTLSQAIATPQFVVVLVARNARGHQAARRGDGKTVGLYQMLDAAIAELHGGQTADASWQVTRYQFLHDSQFRDQGLQIALLQIQADTDPPQKDAVNLGEFLEFHSDFDISPLATAEDRERWVNEDHAAPAPDLQSHINPQEGI
ncbi:phage protein Gp37 [Pseudomonas sp. Q2-TVG4-2]|uniref:phage protein Gp37 n=1 Tax=Pseudomonas sp. Q2-TVG4-2 TaxID=1685699 RepID=UPI0015E65437|nr:phage protein Gp37 [Pseudomonas sp. Q2-TVG4-2]